MIRVSEKAVEKLREIKERNEGNLFRVSIAGVG
jgi:Fe-S cluster assembly iron-binding protein IscA